VYVKLFSSILTSSVWSEDLPTRVVWITMLALADRDGFVRGAPSGLARQANVSLADCLKALKVLESPDLESQSQEWGGRRIETMEGGWLILNYAKYRDLRDKETVREQTRERVRKHRAAKRTVTSVTPSDATQLNSDAGTTGPLDPCESTALVVVKPNGGHPRTFGEIKDHLSVVLGEVQAGRTARLRADEMRTLQAELVFAYWQAETGHERAILDDKRLNRLKRCLKENSGDVHELLYAVDGWRKDPTFKGLADKENRVLDGIENIFTDRARIERLAGHCPDRRKNKPHRMAVKYLEAAQPNGDGASDA